MTTEGVLRWPAMSSLAHLTWPVLAGLLLLLAHLQPALAQTQIDVNCARILSNNNLDAEDKQILCRIYQQASALEQMGAIVNDSLERFMAAPESAVDDETRAKRKHEYLRFGKRKHEYLRFGKRKHEYLRFGRK